jgi:hypothetical protein
MSHTHCHAEISRQKNWGQKYFYSIFLSSIFLTPLCTAGTGLRLEEAAPATK